MSGSGGQPAGRIYVYSAPGYDTEWTRTVGSSTITGRGRFKVGYTGRPDPRVRIKEQTGTVYPGGEGIVVHLDEPAVRDDGTPFTDHDVHKILDAAGIARRSEVVEASLLEIQAAIAAVRGWWPYDPSRTQAFGMRPEQAQAVDQTAGYFREHGRDTFAPRYLWNAKMRFGKTFTTYQLAREMGWKRVLVITYKPAVRSAWRDDLTSHVDFTGWVFADRDTPADPDIDAPLVWFASFQDLLGADADGEVKDHNVDIHLIDWDCIVVDEYHFGAWQGAAKEVCADATSARNTPRQQTLFDEAEIEQADEVMDMASAGTPRLVAAVPDSTGINHDLDAADLRLSGKHYLYLSGTPFRALTEGEFTEDAIFNWTYPDEQHAKRDWDTDPTHDPLRNPYVDLPQMQMFTYKLSELADSELAAHPDGMFDLSGFFAAHRMGAEYQFADPGRVRQFLDMLRGRMTQSAKDKLLTNFTPPFPYSDTRFTDAVQHSVWFLPTVASAHAMAAALQTHPFFKDFLVTVAAGGRRTGAAAKAPVDQMLATAAQTGQQTITLSCGKLMTGVTVPQWGAILVLRTLKSPESYFQAAFRVQSPWTTQHDDGSVTINKNTCYVFDFDPNRALALIYQYGTKLATASVKTAPSDVIRELVDVLPIFAFDGGQMAPVDVETVMNWGTAGAGAAMLARRWGSDRLIDLSESVLAKLLGDDDLVGRLEQMEDFRALREDATKIIANSKKIRQGKQSKTSPTDPDDPEVTAARRARREQAQTLRKKLLKFVQAVPVFMYLTDFREESLVNVIESLDTQLFERVTGLTLDDFHKLADVGVFHPGHMNEAIWQFRLFERASLSYLGLMTAADLDDRTVGLWDRTVPMNSETGP